MTIRRYEEPAPNDLVAMLEQTVALRGDHTAFVDTRGSVTWERFGHLVEAAAVALARLEVRVGDRVAVLASNGIPFTALVWGIWRLGAVVVPLNHRLTAGDLVAQLENCGASLLLVGDGKEALGSAICTARPIDVVTQSSWPDFFGDQAGDAAPTAPGGDAHRPAAILYTSGTTGRPKGVVVSHDNVVQNSITCTRVIGRDATTVELVMVPQFNVTGLCSQTVPIVHLGAVAVLLDRFDEHQAVQLIRKHGITSTVGPPTMWWRILEAAGSEGLPSMRLTLSGGAPIPAELLERLTAACPQATFGNGYGMTETCSMVTYLDGRSEPGHRNSVGKPLPVTDTKLLPLPQSDTDFAAGADVGELAVRGPQVALGYWADGALAPLTDADGWLATGDAVRFDDEFVVLVGRIKDVIKRGGESIFAVEVEDVLHQHPDVLEAALVGVPDVAWGQLPVAVVVARPGRKPDPSDVIAFCRARLAPYKTPSAVRIVPELPRNAGGKVLKAVLVAEAAGDATESPSSGLPGPSTERWPYERGPATRR